VCQFISELKTWKTTLFKYDLIGVPYLLQVLAIAEGAVNLFFFFESPFVGYLIPASMQTWIVTQLLRALVSGLLIPWATLKVNLDAWSVGGFIFLLGPLSFASYLKSVGQAKANKFNSVRRFHALVLRYKLVSLLVIQFNSMFCSRMFIRVVFPGLGIPIICFCSIFLMKNSLSFGMITLLFVFGVVVCLTIHLLLTFCAQVWSDSKRFMWEMIKLNSKKIRFRYSYRKRLLLSMFPIRIKLRESNFVEMSTPLVVMSLCIQQTVNILCLKNKHP